MRTVDALEEAIAARIHAGLEVPSPSKGEAHVGLPTLTAVKVILYQGMRDDGVGRPNWRVVSAGICRKSTASWISSTARGWTRWMPRWVSLAGSCM